MKLRKLSKIIIFCLIFGEFFINLPVFVSAKTSSSQVTSSKFKSYIIKRDSPYIKAKYTGNKVEVLVRLTFTTKHQKNDDIRREILAQFKRLNKPEIKKYLKIDKKQQKKKILNTLLTRATVNEKSTDVVVEYKFGLSTKNKSAMINDIDKRILSLKLEHIKLK